MAIYQSPHICSILNRNLSSWRMEIMYHPIDSQIREIHQELSIEKSKKLEDILKYERKWNTYPFARAWDDITLKSLSKDGLDYISIPIDFYFRPEEIKEAFEEARPKNENLLALTTATYGARKVTFLSVLVPYQNIYFHVVRKTRGIGHKFDKIVELSINYDDYEKICGPELSIIKYQLFKHDKRINNSAKVI